MSATAHDYRQPVPRSRNTADYMEGVEGLVSASSMGLREVLLLEVFKARADSMDDDSRKADTSENILRTVLQRLEADQRLVRLDGPPIGRDNAVPSGERRWGTPAHALEWAGLTRSLAEVAP